MAYKFFLISFILLIPIISYAQVDFTAFGSTDSTRIESAEDIKRYFLELEKNFISYKLDSISQRIDSILNKLDPQSEFYGHQLFKYRSVLPYSEKSVVKVPEDYIIGSGDEISISIFGVSQYDAKLIVGEDGFISPDGLSKILLKGFKWGDARLLLRRRFGRYFVFRDEQFAISLSKPRMITVNIFGEVEKPGSFNLVATNTAFNALFAANGPTENGSIRNIQIFNGSEKKVLDIYELMDNPGAQFQYYLEDNVIIQVPAAQKIITIEGAIRRPMKYELKENEGLKDLIRYAGGLNANAVKKAIQIKRYVNNELTLIDVNLNELNNDNSNYGLYDGDFILIRSISPDTKNSIFIEGAVELDGEYGLEYAPRLSTFLEKSILKREARRDKAFLSRMNPDSTYDLIQFNIDTVLFRAGSVTDLELQAQDKVFVASQASYVNRYFVYVMGAVNTEIKYPFDPDNTLTIEQGILLAGGLKAGAANFGYILRTDLDNLTDKEYIKVDIKSALDSPNGPANIRMKPLDILSILDASEFTDVNYISISGALRDTGRLEYAPSLTLRDILYLQGGFKPEASKKLDIFRVILDQNNSTVTSLISLEVDNDFNIISGPSDFTLKPFDRIVARAVPDFELQANVMLKGEVLFPGEYALVGKNERMSGIIRRAGGLTDEAFPEGTYIVRKELDPARTIKDSSYVVITQLRNVMNKANDKNDFVLKDGDIITIPKIEDVVYINTMNTGLTRHYQELGDSIKTKIAVAYTPGKNAKWYIKQFAAGIGPDLKGIQVVVQFANHSVISSKSFGPFKKYPKPEKGSTITIHGSRKEMAQDKLEADTEFPDLNNPIILKVSLEEKDDKVSSNNDT